MNEGENKDLRNARGSAPIDPGVKHVEVSIRRAFRTLFSAHWVLQSEQQVPARIEKTFAFFSDPANLQSLTPPSLDFAIVTPLPIEMRTGALIEYRLKLMGIPMRWLSRIEAWRPGEGFTDVQLRGPYARWIHHHAFLPNNRGTLVRDEVEYALPLAPLSNPFHAIFVGPQLNRIFRYRRTAIARILGS